MVLVVVVLVGLVVILVLRGWAAMEDELTGLKDLQRLLAASSKSKASGEEGQSKGEGFLGQRAVVVGASWAGCLAAKLLLQYYEEVVVIENEDLSTEVVTALDAVGKQEEGSNKPLPKARAHVAQQWYGHGLMSFGCKVVDAIFDQRFKELVVANGGDYRDFGEIDFHNFGVDFTMDKTDIMTLVASRILLESCVRHLLFEGTYPGKERLVFRPNQQMKELLLFEETSNNPKKVRAVRFQHNATKETTELETDLVIDATGRVQRGVSWLEKLGIQVPKEVFDSKVGYSAAFYSIKDKKIDFDSCLFAFGDAREFSRLAMFINVEKDLCLFTLMGSAGNYPPTDAQEIQKYLDGLPIPDRVKANFAALGEPVAPWRSYKPGPCQLAQYDRCPNLPEGFLAVGDALACFNPTYGQGLTTSAFAVLTLDRLLRRKKEGRLQLGPGETLSLAYARLVAKRLAFSWMLPKCGDYCYPTTETAAGETGNELVYRWFQSYVASISRVTTRFRYIRQSFYGAITMSDFGLKLFVYPHIVLPALAYAVGLIKVPTTTPLPNPETHPYVNPKLKHRATASTAPRY